MNTITKIIAPATLALFAFGAQAANVSTGGETYTGQAFPEAPSQVASKAAPNDRVSTGGEAYSGVANQLTSFTSPAPKATISDVALERIYLG